jgi:hypothetical protein
VWPLYQWGVVYASNNPVTDALGAVFIRLISILTYAS